MNLGFEGSVEIGKLLMLWCVILRLNHLHR